MERIQIGPDFFKKSVMDYAEWRSAWIREILQNSIDARATEITVNFELSDKGGVIATVEDNGCGMSEEVIRTKLLCLGGSGKNFTDGRAGGFGKAKELLYFGQHQYQIETNDLVVKGIGGDYEIKTSAGRVGTKSTVRIDTADNVGYWVGVTRNFVKACEVGARITVDGEVVQCEALKGEVLKEWDFGILYEAKGYHDQMVGIRVHGIHMFSRYMRVKGGLILELREPSYQRLNANRDSLKWEYTSKLDEFATRCATEDSACEKPKKIHNLVYRGEQVAFRLRKENTHYDSEAVSGGLEYDGVCKFFSDFYIESEIGTDIPKAWRPDGFTGFTKWIAFAWTAAIIELQRVQCRSFPFRIGWVFSEDTLAAFDRDQGLFLLNPAKTGTFEAGDIQKNKEGAAIIIAAAIHEYTHKQTGPSHNESFAAYQTHLTADVMKEYKSIVGRVALPEKYLKELAEKQEL